MSVTVEKVRLSEALPYFVWGFLLGILFNLGDLIVASLVMKSWPPAFFFGVPIVALLWVLIPAKTRPFGFPAALFMGLVFGFLGGTLLVLNYYGA